MLGRVRLTNIVRCDHRQLRTELLLLTVALAQRHVARFRRQVRRVTEALGAQFRYEEEALFPALLPVLGEDFIEQLRKDHDDAIGCMESLARIAGTDSIDEKAANSGICAIWRVMENVCAGDRASVLIHDISEESARSIIECRRRAMTDDFDLTTWTQWLRQPAGRAADIAVDEAPGH